MDLTNSTSYPLNAQQYQALQAHQQYAFGSLTPGIALNLMPVYRSDNYVSAPPPPLRTIDKLRDEISQWHGDLHA